MNILDPDDSFLYVEQSMFDDDFYPEDDIPSSNCLGSLKPIDEENYYPTETPLGEQLDGE